MLHKHQPKTIINFILDKSGSMSSIVDATISGFNEYLHGLQSKKDENMFFSLTLFDSDSIEKRYVVTPISKVKKLTRETYRPGSMTPLYDAVVDTVENAYSHLEEAGTNYSSIVVIMTDGEENASQNHTDQCLKELKEKLEKTGKWSFIYMGANQDAWAMAQQWGFSKGNTMTWDSSVLGAQTAFKSMGNATANYCSAVTRGVTNTSNFFAQPAKDK